LPDFLVFAALYAKLRGAKVVFDMHEITPEFLRSKYELEEGHWQVRLAEWIERASMWFANHVITINEPIQRLLEGRGLDPRKSTVITNSVDETLFAASGSIPASLAALGRPAFVMMYHGTLTRIYGLDIAMEGFALAEKEMPGAEFWILGGGTEKESLKALAKRLGLENKVRLVGSVRVEEIPHWLNRCDVGVLATRRDVFLDFSFSNKLSEYVIADKPVIASRLKTIRHYFSEEALAYFEPNDPRDLAKQMVLVFRDAGLRTRLAQRARQEYSPISWGVMKQRYLRMMAHLVGAASEATEGDVACETSK
jgi:glycosyltransferase involved in cell wall biosynthesis